MLNRFRSRPFLLSVLVIWALKLLGLFLSTPLYDLDTNSYIRGGFTWDIYHNPFMNLFIASLGKVWSNAWFIVSVQCLLYALAGAFLVEVLGEGKERRWRWALLGVVCLEPLTGFYNYSLLAESAFTSFTLVTVGAGILYLRAPSRGRALLFGLGLGLTFLCKLSALIHLPLFLLFLFRGPFLRRSVPMGLWALLPFAACYAFVYFGQQAMNGGDLFTVEGRVRWDFSSALYDHGEVEGPAFKAYVHPYIYADGQLEPHRERRREMSYLGYKDCVAAYEARGWSVNRGINACDSLFGAVAAQVMERHFWAVERQFIADNGYHASFEAYTPAWRPIDRCQLRFLGFVDHAWLKNRGRDSSTLTSTGIGIRMLLTERLDLSADHGWRLDDDENQSHVALTLTF